MPFPGWPTLSGGDVKAQAFGINIAQGNFDGSLNSGALMSLGKAVQAPWLLPVVTPAPALPSTDVTPQSIP